LRLVLLPDAGLGKHCLHYIGRSIFGAQQDRRQSA
jgi:hypothetical protein